MFHEDTKRLPLLKGQKQTGPREYFFVAVDDFSRELYSAILLDKTSHSARWFLDRVIGLIPYTIEVWYSDNGKEYKGDPENHAFVIGCSEAKIKQGFCGRRHLGPTAKRNASSGRSWSSGTKRRSSSQARTERMNPRRFVNYYNWVMPHKGIDGLTPGEKLLEYFLPEAL